ncbi:MAG: AraC family transcriptional regulator [Clostridiales bacterium]|nr:AraC family ligand binding domain-containing protein [Clostridiales bacterium]MDU3244628.1 AraC family transcriptional regulator [Clostridiales bacterium]
MTIDERIKNVLNFSYHLSVPPINDNFLFHVIRAGCNYFVEDFEITRDNDYPYYTVHFVFDGCGIFHISKKEHLLKKGDAFIIYPGEAHDYGNYNQSSLGLLWIELSGSNCKELFSYLLSNHQYVFKNVSTEKAGQQLIDILEYLTTDIKEKANNDVNNLEARKNDPNIDDRNINATNIDVSNNNILYSPEINKYELSSKVYTFIMYLLDLMTGIPQKNTPALIVKALSYIDENFTSQIQIRDIAGNLHISHTYLTKLFQKNVGVTPIKYVNMKRIEYACYLLQNTDLSCETISEKTGIYDNAQWHQPVRIIANWFFAVLKKRRESP